jgi:peptidylprolyl isomerase
VLKIIIAVVVIIVVIAFVVFSMGNNKAAEENIKAAKDFLAGNAVVDGVKTTASGLQYQVITAGGGGKSPGPSDFVKVHYHGTLLDGRVFDSSVSRGQPIEFSLNQVIKGWTEGLQLMQVGEKARLYIPSELGYGNRGSGMIPPGSLLIFEVELLAINGES